MSNAFPTYPEIQQDGVPLAKANAINFIGPDLIASETSPGVFEVEAASSPGGTVTNFSFTNANGVSGSVSNATTTPDLTISLGAITPTSVAASGTVTGSNLSGSNTGDQTITLTSDVTGSGTGSFATTISNNAVTTAKINNSAVTYAKIQNETASTLLGNPSAGLTAPSEITLNGTLSFSGTALQRAALTGDVTATAGSNSTTIATSAVTYAKMQNVTASRLLGNPTGSLAAPSEISLNTTLSFTGTTLQRAALTGDVTATAGSNATTIPNDTVTYAKMQNASAGNVVLANPTASAADYSEVALALSTLLGRGSTGNITGITLGTGLAMTLGVLSSTVSGGFTGISLNFQQFNASGTYTKPANTQFVFIMCIGAGGGSGGIAAGTGSCATGGAGSGAAKSGYYIASSLSATEAITIGAAGSAGNTSGTSGTSGGATSMALVSASGGSGSAGATSSSAFQANDGGAGGSTAGGGNIAAAGNQGGYGISHGTSGAPVPGIGGANPVGGGAVVGVSVANQGSGASGASTSTGTATAGRSGGSGYCYIVSFIFT